MITVTIPLEVKIVRILAQDLAHCTSAKLSLSNQLQGLKTARVAKSSFVSRFGIFPTTLRATFLP
jgi:hypothetical protein